MSRTHLAIVAVCLIGISATTTPAEKPDPDVGQAIPLFNGKTLHGWTDASGEPVTRGWTVEDGALVRTERGGAIYAEGEYGDFILDFEWKIAPGGNSGVKYRVQFYKRGVRGKPGWLGCEYQLFDDEAKHPKPESSTGSIYSLFAPNEKKHLNPVGEYNQSRIVACGTKIEHWLNGQKIVEADTASPEWKEQVAKSKFSPAGDFPASPRGRIQLQDHGSKVWFRSITLRPLDPKGDNPRSIAGG